MSKKNQNPPSYKRHAPVASAAGLMGAGWRPKYMQKGTKIKELVEPINSFVLLPDRAMRLLIKLARLHGIGVREMVVIAIMDRARYDSTILPLGEMRKCLSEIKDVQDELEEVWADPPLLPRWFKVSLFSVAKEYGADVAWSLGGGRVGRWDIARRHKKITHDLGEASEKAANDLRDTRAKKYKGKTPEEMAEAFYKNRGLIPVDYNFDDKVKFDIASPDTPAFRKFLTQTPREQLSEDGVYQRKYPKWARERISARRKAKPSDKVWPDEV